MANFQFKAIVSLLMIALSVTSTVSSRILDESLIPPTTAPDVIESPDATVVAASIAPIGADTATADDVPGVAAATTGVGAPTGVGAATAGDVPGVAAATTGIGAATSGVVPGVGAATTGAAVGGDTPDHSLIFFMHDILGGTNPSAIAVTGVVTNPAIGGQVPFAKPNGAVLPLNNGVQPGNNNNLPFLTGLGGTRPNLVQNNNNNGNNIIGGGFGFPALNMAQLQSGTTFQKLMFGTITVFDDEVTEGHELGSGSIGKAQGFYIASSEDGLSQTMAFNVMFASGSYGDSLSFFGVHRPAVSESHLAIMGGTGKYVNAKGFAIVKTLPVGSITQQNTDGLETVLQFNVYLAY